MRSPARRQQGAVAVEFGLSMMVLLPLVLGGIHLGRVLGIRHRISDAAGFAVRAAALAHTPTSAAVRGQINARLGDVTNDCTSVVVTAALLGAAPYGRLEASVTCNLQPPFGAAFLVGIGPDSVAVTAAMPYLAPTP